MRLLVYHIGSLGDTLAAVPALWVVREAYPDAHITILTDEQPGKSRVQPRDILDGSGLIDDYIVYPPGLLAKAQLLMSLRAKKFSALIYLPTPAEFSSMRVTRDRCFFAFAGINKIAGAKIVAPLHLGQVGHPLPTVPHVADGLLARLHTSGLKVPRAGMGRCDIGSLESERIEVAKWLANMPSDGGRSWVAIGPGSKMPAKKWPTERYSELVQTLIEQLDIWPVIFGGPEDKRLGEELVQKWARGYVAAGHLKIRPAMAAMENARLYVGNDTGTMHMAVASGLRCVAIFSARNYPGRWDPYGEGHVVLRRAVSCEGCLLQTCARNMECLTSIEIEDVYEACRSVLQDTC